MLYWIVLLVIELVVLAFALWLGWSAIYGAPWLPTPNKRVRSMLDIAQVNENDTLYDLGSGDGRIVVMAAKEYNARSIGIEIDPLRLFWSRLKIRRHNLCKKASVTRGNFFKVDLSEATVVTLYQGHEINKKIREKLEQDLKSGTRVVSYRFILDGWTPIHKDDELSIYLYTV